MTSQIAVFNPLGVAVASDTVTTISNAGTTKTTNNTQKIFQLPEPHLLVVIESGSVLSNGIHMQVLINEWSRTLKNSMPTVQEYAQVLLTGIPLPPISFQLSTVSGIQLLNAAIQRTQ